MNSLDNSVIISTSACDLNSRLGSTVCSSIGFDFLKPRQVMISDAVQYLNSAYVVLPET